MKFLLLQLLISAIVILSITALPLNGGENISVDGSTTVGPVAKGFAGYYMDKYPEVEITISMTGSGNGAKSLIQGGCDIATMSRFMHPAEYKKAVADNILPVPHMVALDGVAVIVHPGNPVDRLTLKQLKQIYTGEITKWSELGGPPVEIVKLSRDTSSGTYEVFSEMALDNERINDAEYLQSNGAIRARVKNTRVAIGYVSIGFLEGVKPVIINGVRPGMKTVSSGAYALARPLYFWTDGSPELGSHLYRFLMLYQSSTGKQIIKDVGFIPVGG